jgi:SAM-dependent methyltransferase
MARLPCGTVPRLVPIVLPEQRPPVPPAELVHRVAGHFRADEVEQVLRDFDEGASKSVRWLERGLAAVGRSFVDFERLLDFGCGPGRIMRWLGPLADELELHGVDIDADAIEWAERHIPYARFAVAPHEPPMPYPAGHFDLVINHSVFTHLDGSMQDLWLAELRRVTRPGAMVLLTVHGTRHVQTVVRQFRDAGEDPEPYLRQLETEGILFIADDDYLGSTHPPFYHSTFHAPWYVFEHWHEFFHIRAYTPEGSGTQDLVVLERRPDDAPVDAPVRRRFGALPAPSTDGDALAHARELHENWPAPRSVLGRLKRRLLRAEIDRYDRLTAALIETARSHESPARAAGSDRLAAVLPAALYQQAERISLVERDLRVELEELRGRLSRLESS